MIANYMKILVTGARGFVGGHLVKELCDNGHEVTAVLNNDETQLKGILSIAANLSDPCQVENKIDFKKVDAVIHLAGLAAVGPSYDDPLKYIDVNAGIEVNLYEACIKQNVSPRFLIISSGSLYDPMAPMPISEESAVIPSSPYAVSKITQESLADYYGNRGFDYTIARPFNHIGPGQNLGFIVPDLTKQIIDGERGRTTEISVGNLDAKRDYTDVRDIARAYRLLIEHDAKGQTYNICSGNSVSGNEILEMLLAKSAVELTVKLDQSRMRPSDIPEIVGDHSKLTKDTGWEPEYNINQTIEDALADWRSR